MPDPIHDDSAARRRKAARLLTEAGWDEALDRIAYGICHDLNGRVAALEAVAHMAELGAAIPESLPAEAERLGKTANALALLPGDMGEREAGVMLNEVLRNALSLATLAHRKLTDAKVDVEDDLMPVRVNATRVVRGLTVLIDICLQEGAPNPVLRVSGDDESVTVSVSSRAAGPPVSDVTMTALGELFAMDGGRLGRAPAGDGAVLCRFPSLAALRATERRDAF